MDQRNILENCADPSAHKLLIEISNFGLKAYFVSDNKAEPVEAVHATWTAGTDNPLALIENAVYDHPALMDDFNSTILLNTDKILCFPEGTPDDIIYAAMTQVFATSDDDVWIHDTDGIITAYTLCRGLKSFLDRTFSGVRVLPSAAPLVGYFKSGGRLGWRLYADYSGQMLTLMLFSGANLTHVSVRECHAVSDAEYFIFLLWKYMRLAIDDTEIFVSGPREWRDPLMTELRRHVNYVLLTPLPRAEMNILLPTHVLILLN